MLLYILFTFCKGCVISTTPWAELPTSPKLSHEGNFGGGENLFGQGWKYLTYCVSFPLLAYHAQWVLCMFTFDNFIPLRMCWELLLLYMLLSHCGEFWLKRKRYLFWGFSDWYLIGLCLYIPGIYLKLPIKRCNVLCLFQDGSENVRGWAGTFTWNVQEECLKGSNTQRYLPDLHQMFTPIFPDSVWNKLG